MRSEQEMMELILNFAREDDRIRAVILNGSRTNPNVKKDIFQDYDIVYVVQNIESFTKDHSWVDIFGERIMMQMPEAKKFPPPSNAGHFIYLMWFLDGNRIDLNLVPLKRLDSLLKPDSLSELLLDKDNLFENLPPASDQDYLIQSPSEQEFLDSCNEFWWICMNTAKGIWRKELTYAMFMYEQVNRNVFIKMIKWQIGIRTEFKKGAGNLGKHLEQLLTEDEWGKFVETYSDGNYENMWKALLTMCQMFSEASVQVADHFGFDYPSQDAERVMNFLMHVRDLPSDATAIY